mgnify:CR=1 FL=1
MRVSDREREIEREREIDSILIDCILVERLVPDRTFRVWLRSPSIIPRPKISRESAPKPLVNIAIAGNPSDPGAGSHLIKPLLMLSVQFHSQSCQSVSSHSDSTLR